MKLLAAIYSYLMRVGMTPHQSIQRHPLNMRILTILILLSIDIGKVVIYLNYEAKNLKDYTDAIFLITAVSTATLNFAFVTWKMTDIFRLFEHLEDIVNTSKCRIQKKLFIFDSNFHATFA